MALINVAAKEIHCKIVYYGPGLGGKTTNLKYIHSAVPPQAKGDRLAGYGLTEPGAGSDARAIQTTAVKKGDRYVITGEKTREEEEKNEKFHRVERAWGAFVRTIPLPGPVDTEKTTAAFKDGVLTVTLPKTTAAKGTFIPVKAG